MNSRKHDTREAQHEARKVELEEVIGQEIYSFKDVLLDELKFVDPQLAQREELAEKNLVEIQQEILARDHCGLAISGGGIRSATFALGVLQGLAKSKLLTRFQYLSTVSGGGYIGMFFSKWVKQRGMGHVVRALAGSDESDASLRLHARNTNDAGPIRHLRQYSNYLAPRPSLLSYDGGLLLAIYLRNLLLNQLVMLLVAIGLFVAVRGVAEIYCLAANSSPRTPAWFFVLAVGGLSLATIGMLHQFFKHCDLRRGVADESSDEPATGTSGEPQKRQRVQARTGRAKLYWHGSLVTTLLTAMAVSLLFHASIDSPEKFSRTSMSVGKDDSSSKSQTAVPLQSPPRKKQAGETRTGAQATLGQAALASAEAARSGNASRAAQNPLPKRKIDYGCVVATLILSTLGFGLLGIWVRRIEGKFPVKRLVPGFLAGAISGVVLVLILTWSTQTVQTGLTFSVPAVLLSFVLSEMLFVGFAGKWIDELEREWWSSINSRLMLLAGVWMSVMFLAIYSPWIFFHMMSARTTGVIASVAGAGWVGTVLTGLLAASSNQTGSRKKIFYELAAKIAPAAFVVLLLACVSVVSAWLVYVTYDAFDDAQLTGPISEIYFKDLNTVTPPLVSEGWLSKVTSPVTLLFFSALSLVGAAELLSRKIGLNTFSLHNMYANRLVRCYLGATSEDRTPNALTNFDARDDVALTSILPQPEVDGVTAPFHIFNGALNHNTPAGNLVGVPEDYADEMRYRDRKAESFVFTPRFCGSDSTSYCKTGLFADGVTLGTAAAVSGAAVAPNMGYHSAPGITALLTVFNLRLGAWFGNPMNAATRNIVDPRIGLRLLESEFLGITNAKDDYVYVSDGGHFENMGVYELIRRRCRFIVAVDADAAPTVRENIGRIVRLARMDFGVRIEIDATPITPDENGISTAHLVVGRIHYGDVHKPAREQPPHDPDFCYDNNQGIIIWISLAVTGDESGDLKNYRQMHDDFPYRSTADQFFDENEFESYRELGEHSVETMLKHVSLGSTTAPCGTAGDLEERASEEVAQWEDKLKRSFTFTLENTRTSTEYEESEKKMASLLKQSTARELFVSVFNRWLARPDQYDRDDVTQNLGYVTILDKLRQDPRLSRLAAQIYGEKNGQPGSAPVAEDLFAEKIMVGEMMTLLQNAWFCLDLEYNFLHPVHRGWLGVFRRWTSTQVFQQHWYRESDSATPGVADDFSPVFREFVESIRRIESTGDSC